MCHVKYCSLNKVFAYNILYTLYVKLWLVYLVYIYLFRFYIQNLVKYFKSELSGHFLDMMIKMYSPKSEYDMLELNRAMKVHCCISR